jgi:uncharacterized protein
MRTAIWLPALTFAIATTMPAPSPAGSPSFDCAKAATPVEKLICNTPRLGDLDRQLGAAFQQAQTRDPSRRETISAEERRWLGERDRACPMNSIDPAACLTKAYQARLDRLNADAAGALALCRRVVDRYAKFLLGRQKSSGI